jgi:hypothetical protein
MPMAATTAIAAEMAVIALTGETIIGDYLFDLAGWRRNIECDKEYGTAREDQKRNNDDELWQLSHLCPGRR